MQFNAKEHRMQTVTLFALILFAVTYIVMMAFQKIRPPAAVVFFGISGFLY